MLVIGTEIYSVIFPCYDVAACSFVSATGGYLQVVVEVVCSPWTQLDYRIRKQTLYAGG